MPGVGSSDRHLVLIGGGHSHLAVIRRFGRWSVPGVRVTLVARDVQTPYSGMLPGLIAGHYSREEAHIDLARLCEASGVALVHAAASGLDLDGQRVLAGDRAWHYDVLSIDIGSTPDLGVPGAREHVIPVKPIAGFLDRWNQLEAELGAGGDAEVVVVGGGVGGVELTLSVEHRLRARGVRPRVSLSLVTASELVAERDHRTRARLRRLLEERGVTVHEHRPVTGVTADRICCEDRAISADHVLWVTGAAAAPWLADAGLAVDDGGFVRVLATLESISHTGVFAAGDIASVDAHPRPKAGVIAVRQGPPLAENLRRALAGAPRKPFVPQRHLLALISTGDRSALATRKRLWAHGRWVWRLKDWIDRRFVARYS